MASWRSFFFRFIWEVLLLAREWPSVVERRRILPDFFTLILLDTLFCAIFTR